MTKLDYFKNLYFKLYKDRLLSNSIYLMMSTFIMSLTGFVFWFLNTKLYSPEEIGLTTTFISVTTLITSFSMLGLNIATVRFLPKEKKKNELINTVFTLILIVSFILTIFFILGMNNFSPPMKKILNSYSSLILFSLFIPLASLNMITDSVFISNGKAIYTLIINTLMSTSKLGLSIVLIYFGVYGLISSFAISTLIATFASILFLILKFNYTFSFKVHPEQIAQMWKFSFGNYLSSILSSITSLLTPLLITSKLSPEITAYYYMPTMIIGLLLSIPRSTVSSLIAEGSREEEPLRKLALKSTIHVYGLMIPAILIIFLFGNLILSAFGKNYSTEGLLYLQMLLVSILFSVPGFISGAILSVKKKIRLQVMINFISAILSLSLNIALLHKGLFGLGMAAILYQLIINFIYFTVISIQFMPDYFRRVSTR